jgi:hypothetical protein
MRTRNTLISGFTPLHKRTIKNSIFGFANTMKTINTLLSGFTNTMRTITTLICGFTNTMRTIRTLISGFTNTMRAIHSLISGFTSTIRRINTLISCFATTMRTKKLLPYIWLHQYHEDNKTENTFPHSPPSPTHFGEESFYIVISALSQPSPPPPYRAEKEK